MPLQAEQPRCQRSVEKPGREGRYGVGCRGQGKSGPFRVVWRASRRFITRSIKVVRRSRMSSSIGTSGNISRVSEKYSSSEGGNASGPSNQPRPEGVALACPAKRGGCWKQSRHVTLTAVAQAVTIGPLRSVLGPHEPFGSWLVLANDDHSTRYANSTKAAVLILAGTAEPFRVARP